MINKNKIFVILHGAWQASDSWQPVADLLNQAGFPVNVLDLPGHGAFREISFHKINLQTYVNFVCQKVQELQQDFSVILVGHSMSGMVISQVAQNIPVQKLIYVSGFLPVNNECLLDIAKHSPIIGISKNMIFHRTHKSISLDKNGLDRLFYNGCTPEVIELGLSRLQDEPLLPFYGRVRLTTEKFGQIPRAYIECTKDFSISIKLQRSMHRRWPCDVYSLEAGHSPFYSAPENLADALIHCVK